MASYLPLVQALGPWIAASVALISAAVVFHQGQRTRELELESIMLKTLLDHISTRAYPESGGRTAFLEYWKWSAANVVALGTVERFSMSVGWWSKAHAQTRKYALDLAELLMEDRQHLKTGMAELVEQMHPEGVV